VVPVAEGAAEAGGAAVPDGGPPRLAAARETSDKLRNGLRESGGRGDGTSSRSDRDSGGRGDESGGVFPRDKVQTRGRGSGKGDLEKIDLEKDGSGLHGHRFFEGRHQVGMVETT